MSEARPALRLAAVWGLVVAVVSWPYQTLVVGTDLDPSWKLALSRSAAQGRDFGRDVVFTYGPLNFLGVEPNLAVHRNAAMSLAWNLGWRAVLAAVVYRSLSSAWPRWLAAAWCLLIVGLVPTDFGPATILVAGALVLARQPASRRTEPAWFLMGVVAGALFLIKLSSGILAVGITGLAVGLDARAGLPRRATAAALGLLAGAVIPWVVMRQSIGALPDYVMNGLQIADGYQDAMARGDSLSRFATFLIVAIAAVAVIARDSLDDLTSRQRALVGLVIAAFVFVVAKYSATRAGGHLSAVFFTLPALASVLRIGRTRLLDRDQPELDWGRLLLLAAAWVALALTAVGFHPFATGGWERVNGTRWFARSAVTVAVPSRWEHEQARAMAEGRAWYRVPPDVLQAIDGEPVMIWPILTGAAWAYGLAENTLPVPQTYSAYTADLDELNAAYLRSDAAPRRALIHRHRAIDHRADVSQSPATSLELLCSYHPVRTSTQADLAAGFIEWGVFERGPSRCGAARDLGTRRVGWSEVVELPQVGANEALVAKVEGLDHRDAFERLRRLVFRGRLRGISLDEGPVQRLVSGTASNGLILVLRPELDLPHPFAVAAGTPRTVRFEREEGEHGEGSITVRFHAVPVAPLEQ